MIKLSYKKNKDTILKTMTFVEALKNGLINYEDIDDFIDEWHNSNSNQNIAEFLGMTKQQYFKYLKEHIQGLKKMFPRG